MLVYIKSLFFNSAGPVFDAKIAGEIEAYAKKVKQHGFWLDVQDALLFSEHCNKMVALCVQRGEKLEMGNLHTYLSHAFQPYPAARHSVLEKAKVQLDLSSPETWGLIACSCNFSLDPDAELNHWVPCFFKSQVSPESYLALTVSSWEREEKEIQQLQRRVSRLNTLIDDTELDQAVLQSQLCTAKDKIQMLLGHA